MPGRAAQPFVEPFMTAASPGIIATTLLNAYYDSYEHYVDGPRQADAARI